MSAYAGIGARATPADVLLMMRVAAARLAERGFILRTGGAEGADRAFFDGAQSVGGRIELYLPWPTFWTPPSFASVEFQTYPSREAYQLAQRYHSNWKNLRRSIRSLHARNAHQVLGHTLDEPAKFILCWTPEGAASVARARRSAWHPTTASLSSTSAGRRLGRDWGVGLPRKARSARRRPCRKIPTTFQRCRATCLLWTRCVRNERTPRTPTYHRRDSPVACG